jgi:hypothetical protein
MQPKRAQVLITMAQLVVRRQSPQTSGPLAASLDTLLEHAPAARLAPRFFLTIPRSAIAEYTHLYTNETFSRFEPDAAMQAAELSAVGAKVELS